MRICSIREDIHTHCPWGGSSVLVRQIISTLEDIQHSRGRSSVHVKETSFINHSELLTSNNDAHSPVLMIFLTGNDDKSVNPFQTLHSNFQMLRPLALPREVILLSLQKWIIQYALFNKWYFESYNFRNIVWDNCQEILKNAVTRSNIFIEIAVIINRPHPWLSDRLYVIFEWESRDTFISLWLFSDNSGRGSREIATRMLILFWLIFFVKFYRWYK